MADATLVKGRFTIDLQCGFCEATQAHVTVGIPVAIVGDPAPLSPLADEPERYELGSLEVEVVNGTGPVDITCANAKCRRTVKYGLVPVEGVGA